MPPKARYAGTETIGFVAKSIQILKNTLTPISEWVSRLDRFLKNEPEEPGHLRNYVSALIVYHLLKSFPPNAQLEFFEYQQAHCKQHEVEATWSIGALADIVK